MDPCECQLEVPPKTASYFPNGTANGQLGETPKTHNGAHSDSGAWTVSRTLLGHKLQLLTLPGFLWVYRKTCIIMGHYGNTFAVFVYPSFHGYLSKLKRQSSWPVFVESASTHHRFESADKGWPSGLVWWFLIINGWLINIRVFYWMIWGEPLFWETTIWINDHCQIMAHHSPSNRWHQEAHLLLLRRLRRWRWIHQGQHRSLREPTGAREPGCSIPAAW